MGKFDGFLICSDLDGTFRGGEDTVKRNGEAVRYFIENGGTFTFATGRSVAYLRNPEFFSVINAPACLCNGAVVYDYQQKQVLRKVRVPFSLQDFLSELSDMKEIIKGMALFFSETKESMIVEDFSNIPAKLLCKKMLKIVCIFEEKTVADAFQKQMKRRPFFADCSILKSWPVGVEFNSSLATKGQALDFLKEHLGTIHTAVGIGDYENDIPLLMHADMGVAPRNAIDSVKKVADMIVKRADQYAIEHLIEELEKEIG
ncbi:MAG: HAD-IIB family hydrolase [Ruminococcaceae bacterium]|nr:HAD-IIB family hydrolase [Oscillospiraceae bacterium]